MLLSPADFDAYSRATGRPLPEEPEEKARLVPEVSEFRRNQLKSPETQRSEGSGLLQALGIGAAVLGGGALLARGLGRRGGIRMGNAQQAAKEAVQEVNVQDLGNVYRAAGRPAPSRPAPTPTPTQRTAPTPDPWAGSVAATPSTTTRPAPTPTLRPAGSRQGGVQVTNLYELANLKPEDLRRAPETLSEAAQSLSGKDFISDYFKRSATPAGTLTETFDEVAPLADRADELLQERELNRQRDIARKMREQESTIRGKGERLLNELLAESRAGQQPVVAVEKVIPESLVTKQQTIGGRVADQTVNAIDSAEDQMTGRVKSQLQRNEDLDLSQIDLLEEMAEQNRNWMMEQDEPINQVASKLPDGLPVDQAEGLAKSSAQSFLQRERDEIASQLGEQNLPVTSTRIEQELSRRLGKEASGYGSKYTARRQALELFAKTGDPQLAEKVQRFGLSPVTFETMEGMPAAKRAGFESAPAMSLDYYPSEELTAAGLSSSQNINLPGVGNVSLADIRRPVVTESTAQQAEEFYQGRKGKALDWLGEKRVELEPKRNQILKERQLLAQQSANQIIPQLNEAKATGQLDKVEELEFSLNTLRSLYKNPRLGTHREGELRSLDARIAKAQNKIAGDVATIQKRYPTTLEDWSGEAPRLFAELDPDTGEIIPETVELRAERPMVDLEPKGGGGRNVAEFAAGSRSATENAIREVQQGGRRTRVRDFDIETGGAVQNFEDDRTQTGRVIGRYGIQPSGEKPADTTKRPSLPRYTQEEILSTALENAQADPYGDAPIPPDYEEIMAILGTKEKPSTRQNIRASEDILRIQRAAPPGKAQALVNQYLNNLRGA